MSEKKRITICSPCKGGIPWYFLRPLITVLTTPHEKFTFNFLVEAGNNAIGISRNILADAVINDPQNPHAVVMIDSDAFWTPEQLYQICSHQEEFVAGPYVRKHSGPVSWLIIRTPGTEIRADGMMELDYAGTHFHYFKTSALKAMRDFYPERMFTYDDVDGEFKNKKMCELFPIGLVGANSPEGRIARINAILDEVNQGACSDINFLLRTEEILTTIHPSETRMLGEDYSFSRLARKAGFKIWCDRNLNPVGHVGDVVYPIGPNQNSVATPFPFSHESMKDLINY